MTDPTEQAIAAALDAVRQSCGGWHNKEYVEGQQIPAVEQAIRRAVLVGQAQMPCEYERDPYADCHPAGEYVNGEKYAAWFCPSCKARAELEAGYIAADGQTPAPFHGKDTGAEA